MFPHLSVHQFLLQSHLVLVSLRLFLHLIVLVILLVFLLHLVPLIPHRSVQVCLQAFPHLFPLVLVLPPHLVPLLVLAYPQVIALLLVHPIPLPIPHPLAHHSLPQLALLRVKGVLRSHHLSHHLCLRVTPPVTVPRLVPRYHLV